MCDVELTYAEGFPTMIEFIIEKLFAKYVSQEIFLNM